MKNYRFTICLSFLFGFSCSYNSVNTVRSNNNLVQITNKKGASIQVSFLFDKNFKTKSISGEAAKNLNDVKSYDIFLSSNYDDPLANNTNPFGNSTVLRINAANATENNSVNVTFNNIPSGGPYYAVVAAYDGLITDKSRNNITELDNTIISANKRFARSDNSVVVNTDLSTTISDKKSSLNISALQLQNEKPVSIDSSVILTDLPIPDLSVSQ